MQKKWIAMLLALLLLPTGALAQSFMTLPETDPINRRISPNTAQTLDFMPEAARERTDSIVIGVLDLLGEANPFWAATTGDGYVASLMFDELLFMSNNGAVGPGVASYAVSGDGGTVTFTVSDKAQYVDGTPVRSVDFINALYLLLTPGYDGAYDISRAGIAGVEAYLQGEAEEIEGITYLDEKRFAITLASAGENELAMLAIPALRVEVAGDMKRPAGLSAGQAAEFYKGAVAAAHGADAVHMAYGQYIVASMTPQERAVLRKNGAYWRGEPYIGTIELLVVPVEGELSAIMSGDVDIVSMLGSVEAVDTVANYETGFINLSTWEGDVVGYLSMDLENPVFADKAVRQALAVGFDREAARYMRIERYGKVPNVLLFDSFDVSTRTTPGEQYAYDTARAEALLASAGWEMGEDGVRTRDGVRLAFTLTYNSPNPVMDTMAQKMQGDWALLGIEMEIEKIGFDALADRVASGDYEMCFEARRLPSSEAVAASLFAGQGHLNVTGYTSEMVDRLFAMVAATSDAERQTVLYEMIFQEIYMDLPIIPLYRRSEFLLVNARVMNVVITTSHDIVADAYRFFLTDTLEGQW